MAQAQLAEDAGLQLPDDWEAQLDARLAAAGVEHEGEPDPEFPLHEVRTYRLVDLETAAQVGERLAARQARLARLAAGEGEQVDLVSEGEEGGVGVGGGAAAGAAASVARPARFAYGTPPALDADERAELLRMYMEEEVEGMRISDASRHAPRRTGNRQVHGYYPSWDRELSKWVDYLNPQMQPKDTMERQKAGTSEHWTVVMMCNVIMLRRSSFLSELHC